MMVRRSLSLSPLIAIMAALAALVSVCEVPAFASAPPTAKVIIDPIDQYGFLKSGYSIAHTFTGGNCFQGSEAVKGADRCFAGNYVIDPCWPTTNNRGTYGGSYCPSAPWASRTGVLVRGQHQTSTYAPGRSVWGMRTAAGERCGFIGGATATYRGQRLNYGCGHNHYLVGAPSRRYPAWTILEVTYNGARYTNVHRVRLTTAWLAVSPDGA